jgi:hypothetical protein
MKIIKQDGGIIHLEEEDHEKEPHEITEMSKESDDGKLIANLQYCEHGVSLLLLGDDFDLKSAMAWGSFFTDGKWREFKTEETEEGADENPGD